MIPGPIERLKAKLPPRLLRVYQTISLGGKRVTAGYGLSLLMLAILCIVSYQNAVRLTASAERVRRIQMALKALNHVTTLLANADYGRRGYYLYNDQAELEIYQSAVAELEPALVELERSLTGLPAHAVYLDQLRPLTAARLTATQQTVNQFQQTRVPLSAQDPLIGQVRQNQRQIQQLLRPLQTELEAELQILSDVTHKGLRTRIMIEATGTLFTFLISLLVYFMLCRQKMGRLQAEKRGQILAQANELSEVKLQFFSMVSHEFRTPLSVILGSAQMLEHLSPQAEGAQRNVQRIQSSAQRMTRLLSDVLTIARADAGKLEFQPTLVELQSFCLNLIEDFQTFAEQKRQIQFSQQINRPEFATHARLDERLIYSILSNLLSNALKYSPPDCPVEFKLICDRAVIFQISDQGIGISAADQKQLYEPFSRGQNTATVTGTGLGLALVKRCVDLHQGEVALHSLEDIGTTVTVTIPQESL